MNLQVIIKVEFNNTYWWKSTGGRMFMDYSNGIFKNNRQNFLKLFGKTYRYIGNYNYD